MNDIVYDDSPTDGFRHHPLWLIAVAGLLLAQAGLVLALFGPARSWAAVVDDRPITSGRHPLHLYHGTLGAATFRDRWATTCYDPAFQAGYPKTPVFDGGCRPAELFLAAAGGEYRPSAYKFGLFTCLMLIPLVFVVASRGAGLPAGASVLAGVGGVVLSWSAPVRALIADGNIDFLMAGLAALVFITWLARYAKWFGIDSWFVLAIASTAGWYAHPIIWVGLLPIVLGYFLVLAPRQGPAWHLGLLGITTAGLAPNLWWLMDWGRYWWLRQPSTSDHIPLPEFETVLGAPADYATLCTCVPGGAILAVGGALGLVSVWRAGHRAAAVLLLTATVITIALARLAVEWSRVPADVYSQLIPLAAAFLIPPAAFGLWQALGRFNLAGPGALSALLGLVLVGWADGPGRPLAEGLGMLGEPLLIGLSSDQQELVAALQAHTTTEGRILWDETTDEHPGWNWSAILPVLTDRAFIGGLDHDAGVEHSYCGLRDGQLNGLPLNGPGGWTHDDLATFCRLYNIGWVVCRSREATERWGRIPTAKPVARLNGNGRSVVIFALDRPLSFVLSGSATWTEASTRRIILTDVVPDASGRVDLSLHALEGMRVYPSYIKIEQAEDPIAHDPIKHIRLILPCSVPRVTLMWEGPQ